MMVLVTSGVIQIFPEKLAASSPFWERHVVRFGAERRMDGRTDGRGLPRGAELMELSSVGRRVRGTEASPAQASSSFPDRNSRTRRGAFATGRA